MTDDEFKVAILTRLNAMQRGFGSRLDAVIARLDVQDNAYDLISGKLDRLSALVNETSKASQQALDVVVSLGRRVTRLEHPQGGN